MALGPHSERRARRAGPALAALLGVLAMALLASACGGSSPTASVAAVGSTGTTSTTPDTPAAKADPTAFAACMRKHGVKGLGDPDAKGHFTVTSSSNSGPGTQVNGVDPNGALWQAAMKSCRQFAPNGGKPDAKAQAVQVKAMLAFASCMRAHGVTNFPDPKVAASGAISQVLGRGDGLDPSSPTFKAAQAACQKLQPGGPKPAGGSGGTLVLGGPSSTK